jgi:UDP-N-acetylmuramoyl-tripeptide--D-alanyl-D-alanine ligase
MVKPDFAVFTGICNQHVETFGSLDNVWEEKSKILFSGAKVVCAESLQERAQNCDCIWAQSANVKDVDLQATKTRFTLTLGGEDIAVETALLGKTAVENILLAATLALNMGLTPQEIQAGLGKLQPVAHRLQLIQSGGAYILDDGYNANIRGAEEALKALCRFDGRKCVVTPGLVECGILQTELNARLGERIANANLDKVIFVGETLVGALKNGYTAAGGEAEKCVTVKTLVDAQTLLQDWIGAGDCVLFLNDLPDVY